MGFLQRIPLFCSCSSPVAQVIEKNLRRITLLTYSLQLYPKNKLFHKCSQAQRLEYCFECMNFCNIFVFYDLTPDPFSVMVKLPLNMRKCGRRRSLIQNHTKIQKV